MNIRNAIAGIGLTALLLGVPSMARAEEAKKEEEKNSQEKPKTEQVSLEQKCKDHKYVEMKPEAQEHYDNGVRAQMTKEYDKALSEYKKAMNIDPKARSPPYQIGTILMEKGDFKNAIEFYSKAINNDPCFPLGYRGLGHSYFELKDFEKSIRYNELYLKFNPKNPEKAEKEIEEAKKYVKS